MLCRPTANAFFVRIQLLKNQWCHQAKLVLPKYFAKKSLFYFIIVLVQKLDILSRMRFSLKKVAQQMHLYLCSVPVLFCISIDTGLKFHTRCECAFEHFLHIEMLKHINIEELAFWQRRSSRGKLYSRLHVKCTSRFCSCQTTRI